jgi:hypothetical protein
MNTRHDTYAVAHGHHPHVVTLLNEAIARSDKTLLDEIESNVDIRLCAFHNWEAAGRPAGDDVQFWLAAEKQLAAEAQDARGHGNSQDADRHSAIHHPHSLKL